GFAHASGSFGDHRFFSFADGPRFGRETIYGGIVPVPFDEGDEGLDKMPGGTVDARFVGRMNVLAGTTPPTFATSGHFQFDNSFSAETDRDHAIKALGGGRHEDADAFGESSLDFGAPYNLRE